MTGTRYHPPGGAPIPYDPDDFGRCHRLLDRFPAWRLRLGEVPAVYPAWTPLVPAWDELTALYVEELPSGRCPKLYARLRELRDAAYEADGWVRTGPNGWKKTALAAWKASPDAVPRDDTAELIAALEAVTKAEYDPGVGEYAMTVAAMRRVQAALARVKGGGS